MIRSVTNSPHSTQERPPALLGRLIAVVPSARRSVAVAIVLGLTSTLALIIQFVGLSWWLTDIKQSSAAWWFVIGLGIRAATALVQDAVTTAAVAPVRRELRSRALRGLLAREDDVRHADELTQLLVHGVNEVGDFLATYTPALVLSTMAPLVMLTWMACTDWLSASIVAATILALPLFMILMGLEAQARMDDRFVEQQRAIAYFGDVLRGISTLKAHRREGVVLEGFANVEGRLLASTMATLRVAFLSSFSLELLASLATALVALTLGVRLMHGGVSLHVALAVLLLTPESYLPLRRAAARFHDAHDGVAAASELLALVSTEVPTSTVTFNTELAVRDVVARHESREIDVAPVSFTVPIGTWVDIVGPSGSGKSTLLRTVAGLRLPTNGQVLMDGALLDEKTSASWQELVGWLGQDSYLDGATLMDAVRAGRQNISDHEISDLLQRFAITLPLDTPIGENGARLSAGQRRRVALARTLVSRPRLVVLDEPYAHLDHDSEAIVQRVLAEISSTFIVATHRPSRRANFTVALAPGVVRG